MDKKARKVIDLLKYNTRDEAAELLGYKSYKSMDQYMRRRDFIYDPEEGQYVVKENKDIRSFFFFLEYEYLIENKIYNK